MPKKILNITLSSLMVILIIIAGMLLFMRTTGKSPDLFGYQIFYVSTGSMEPEVKVGELILNKKVAASELQVGDIITYHGLEGEVKGLLVTHKITAIDNYDGTGYTIHTKGTAEGTVEDPAISDAQVESKMVAKLTVLSFIYALFKTPVGLFVFLAPIIIFLFQETVNLINTIKYKENSDANDSDKNKKA